MALGPRDPVTGVHTTGHEWAGITELDNPIPTVVKLSYAITFAIAVLLWLLYPAWPLISTYSQGLLSWSQRAVLASQLDEAAQVSAPRLDRIAVMEPADIAKDATLEKFVQHRGARLFADNCAVCHGQQGKGRAGFPNLSDGDWLWGGGLKDIQLTLEVGVNGEHEETRTGAMPAFGTDDILQRAEIIAVADYVRRLSGLATKKKDGADDGAGRALFAENCASCHGAQGRGNKEMGAPNLTDDIWLYGNSPATIYQTVYRGRVGQMPRWSGRFSPAQIKIMTVYVNSLSHP